MLAELTEKRMYTTLGARTARRYAEQFAWLIARGHYASEQQLTMPCCCGTAVPLGSFACSCGSFWTPGDSVPQLPAAGEPFTAAVRSRERLARALELIGIAVGPGALRLYADVDPLGAPIVVPGPLGAELADRLSSVLEGGPLPMLEGGSPCS
jgi:hypothetical protein